MFCPPRHYSWLTLATFLFTSCQLAQQLQNEELKAASRYRVEKTSAPHKAPEPAPKASASAPKFPASTAKKPDAAPKPAAETSPKKLAPKRGGGSGGMLRAQAAGPSKGAKRKAEEEEEEAAAEVLLAAMSKSTAAATKVAKKPKAASAASPLPKTSKAEKANAKDTSKNALKKLSKIGAIEIKATKAAKEETSKPTGDGKKEAEGTVQFTLAPVDDLPPMSAANSMAKTMDEDTTVMQVRISSPPAPFASKTPVPLFYFCDAPTLFHRMVTWYCSILTSSAGRTQLRGPGLLENECSPAGRTWLIGVPLFLSRR